MVFENFNPFSWLYHYFHAVLLSCMQLLFCCLRRHFQDSYNMLILRLTCYSYLHTFPLFTPQFLSSFLACQRQMIFLLATEGQTMWKLCHYMKNLEDKTCIQTIGIALDAAENGSQKAEAKSTLSKNKVELWYHKRNCSF